MASSKAPEEFKKQKVSLPARIAKGGASISRSTGLLGTNSLFI